MIPDTQVPTPHNANANWPQYCQWLQISVTPPRNLQECEKYIRELEGKQENSIKELIELNWELEELETDMEELETDMEELEHELMVQRHKCIKKDGVILGLQISLKILGWQDE